MMNRVVLISCVSKKLRHRAEARLLYTSTLFQYNLKYAQKLAPDAIFILSAKHGLVPLDRVIEPYDETLNRMSSHDVIAWARKVLSQLELACDMDMTEFTFLAGFRYRKYLTPHLQFWNAPLIGLRIGEQLKALKRLVT